MRYVYVLENDLRFLNEIAEALRAVDPNLKIRYFESLEKFSEWIKLAVQHEKASLKMGGMPIPGVPASPDGEGDDATLQLVISKIEFLGPKQLGLLKKARDLFVKHKLCTAEDPTAMVLTAFEDAQFHVQDFRDRVLSNVIMKPFDRLILQQHLTHALDGRHPPSKQAIAPFKSKAMVEVLKSIQMDELSVIGFRTKSDRALPAGATSKYYGSLFESVRHKSAMARLLSCQPDPTAPGSFVARFEFFALDSVQISNIRKKILENKAKRTLLKSLDHTKNDISLVRIALIEDRDDIFQNLEATFKRKIKNAAIYRYKTLSEFYLEWDPSLDTSKPPPSAMTAESVEFEITELGLIKEVVENQKFDQKPFVKGQSILPFFNPAEFEKFKLWLKSPQGDWHSHWPSQAGPRLMRIAWESGRKFRVYEANKDQKIAYLRQNSRLAHAWDFLFIGNRFVNPDELKLWGDIFAKAKDMAKPRIPRQMLIAGTDYSDEQEKQLSAIFDDVFYFPLERVYIMQKLLNWQQQIEILEEPIEIFGMDHSEVIQSARPVQIEELSEAGLVIHYDRQIELGDFREFVLWQDNEVTAPELTAACNYVEAGSGAGSFKLHFVFFAMKDSLLKGIRSWILSSYAKSKNEGQ
jgi:hypothetical protein